MKTRLISLWMAAWLLVVAGASASSSDAVGECQRPSIVGAWTATVYRDDGAVERDAELWFGKDGTLITRGAIGQGVGTWNAAGGQWFSYATLTDTRFGYLVVSATVRLIGDRFVGEGEGAVYDAADHLLGTGRSVIVAVRATNEESDR